MFSVNPFSKKPFSNGSGNPAITYGYNIDTYNNPFGNPSTSLGLEGSVTLPNYQDFANEIINSITSLASRSERDNPTIYQSGNGGGNDNKKNDLLGPISSDRAKEIANSTQNLIKETFSKNKDEGNYEEGSFSDKFSNSTFGKDFDKWSQGLNIANNLFTTFAGEKSEYSGTKGGLARGIDSAYDTVQSVVSSFGPIGQFASLIMGGNKLLGNVANKLGAGTDGMTTTDAILNSSFLQLTPFGMINGFGGKKTMSFTKDNLAFAQVGSSYTGTSANVDDALSKANKKYGLFSLGALDKANDKIIDARRQQQIMSNIADTASDRFALSDSMAAINNSRMALNLMGGYDQSSVRVGKAGMILQLARGINSKPSVLKEITEIPTEFLEIDEFKEGGTIPKKTRTLEELIQYAKELNPRFIQRLSEAPKGIDFIDDEGNQARGSHYLAYSTDDDGNAIIYPRIQEIDGELKLLNDEDAYNKARENKNNLVMTIDEAKIFFGEDPEFGTAYKKGWPEFFKKFQKGGVLKEVTEIPVEFLEIDEFKKGGSISQKIKDYYKEYDLSNVTLINDSSPRTEGNVIYSPDDEYTVHELWHYLSQNKPNEALKEFYDQIDDTKLQKFGADLDFVKRTGDPSDFYHPSELEARLKAAKFMSQGALYDKEFFKNLRSDENKYGNNMRDLLRMFNDEYLEKLFNALSKFKKGGKFNIIPEGALHARKHNMDVENITQKGIPVVSESADGEIVQQAEIERQEIIFRLEVTKKLEELAKDGSDEAAIEAGKLLVQEILYNTIDNTNTLL